MAKKRTLVPPEHVIETRFLPSASNFDSNFRCPGQWAMELPLPWEEDSSAAQSGKRVHKALETCSLEGLNKSEARTASRCMYGEAEIVHEYSFEGAEVTFEERFWDFDDKFNRLWSGRVDRHDWQPDKRRLWVNDAKCGWGLPLPVNENWQVRSEAGLLCERYDALEVVVSLIHPHHPDSLWEAQVFTQRQCLEFLDTVRHNVAMIQMPNMRRVPGGIQCEWCLARGICPEFKEWEAALDKSVDEECRDEGFTAIIERSPEQRGAHVQELKMRMGNIERILEQYVMLAEKEDAGCIKGWKLTRRWTRVVTSDEEAMSLIRKEWGDEAVYAGLKLSLTGVEEFVATKLVVGGKKKAKEMLEQVLNPVLKFRKGVNFLTESRSL